MTVMSKNLVDTSAWLEYFTNGPNAEYFAKAIEDTDNLIVSVINIYEIYKKILTDKSKSDALEAIALLMQGTVIDFNIDLAIKASQISKEHKLPMADSILLATALKYNSILWTQDQHFENISDIIRYKPKLK
jgi:predicted nucleic acid-binding protein